MYRKFQVFLHIYFTGMYLKCVSVYFWLFCMHQNKDKDKNLPERHNELLTKSRILTMFLLMRKQTLPYKMLKFMQR